MKKISLVIISALIFTGCSAIDDAINDAVNDIASGDVTTETIKAKDKVLVINDVSLSACVIIKNGLVNDDDFKDAVTLVTELGVTCATYGKTTGDPEDIDTECVEQSLAEWLEEEGHEEITDLDSAQGDKACVIGADV
ncbi:hypothetical protein ACLHDG_12195 [Sulfurovum sp. CS9]|uniref:hypothetical protein n=1 Tax=Sulfurovum sp. CS9 TaxID=3391146 RepID=UPI0039EB3BAE